MRPFCRTSDIPQSLQKSLIFQVGAPTMVRDLVDHDAAPKQAIRIWVLQGGPQKKRKNRQKISASKGHEKKL